MDKPAAAASGGSHKRPQINLQPHRDSNGFGSLDLPTFQSLQCLSLFATKHRGGLSGETREVNEERLELLLAQRDVEVNLAQLAAGCLGHRALKAKAGQAISHV